MNPSWRRGGGAAILIALMALLGGCSGGDLQCSVVFDDVVGLDVGAPVLASGLEVGRVSGLELGRDEVVVRVSIAPEYRDRVTKDSQFWLQRKHWISSEKRLELRLGDGDPVSFGHRFRGRSGTSDVLGTWIEDLRGALDDPELRRSVEELGAEIDALADAGREEWDRLVPQLEEQADQLLEEAERQGSDVAEAIRREIERIREEWEGADDDGPI